MGVTCNNPSPVSTRLHFDLKEEAVTQNIMNTSRVSCKKSRREGVAEICALRVV